MTTRTTVPLLPLILARVRPSRMPLAPGVWVQGVSVGEVEVAVGLADALRDRRPALPLLVTSTTPAGVALLRRRLGKGRAGVESRPFPLDLPSSVRRFFDAARPRLLVLVETELWPVVLSEARKRSVPVLLVNGRLSERSARRIRAAGRLGWRPLAALTHVLARTSGDASRFEAAGVPPEKISLGGDMKLDRALPAEPAFAARFRELAGGRPVLAAGSMADEELGIALEVSRRLKDAGVDIFLLLAPRRPESFEAAARRVEEAGLSVARRTTASDGIPENPARPDVFLLDTMGELAAAYRLADIALLGGTFAARGGHNVLEPLRAGLPTLHGPSVWSIRETLEAAGGAVRQTPDPESAAAAIERLLQDDAARENAASAAASLFSSHAGATGAAADMASSLLPEPP